MLRVFFFSLVLIAAVSQAALADTAPITKKMITDKYATLEKVLNERSDYNGTIRFLHDHISEDALFKLTVTNPMAGVSGKSPVMEMNKQDYINTYLQGTQHVAGYSIAIKTAAFHYDAENHEAYTVDIMTERGMMPIQMNKGKPFISRTTCRTRHEMRQGMLVAIAGECHTAISFEEEI